MTDKETAQLERQLKLLTSQREYAFRDVQLLYELSKEIGKDNSSLAQFEARFKRLDNVRKEFMDYTCKINELKLKLKPQEVIDMQPMHALDDMYYATVAARSALSSQTIVKSSDSESSGIKPYSQARLPKLELPKFDGNIECWQTFFDTFSSLVHENNNITSIEKFHYLLSSLSGTALSIAKGVPVTSDNYTVVYNALVERFQNKRILAAAYLNKICNLSQLKSGNFNDLRDLSNLLNETVNALKAMKIRQLDEFILFYLGSRVLDNDTRRRFETQNEEEIPTFSELLKFLQNYVKVLEASQSGSQSGSGLQPKQLNKNNSRQIDTRGRNNNNYKSTALPSSTSVISNAANKSADCVCCGQSHALFKCSKFLSLNIPEKYRLVTNKSLCSNCLRPNHNASKCFSKSTCSSCQKRHHTLLHDSSAEETSVAVPCSSLNVTNSDSSVVSATTSTHVGHSRTMVLLGTCVVRVCGGSSGQSIRARALIDSAAQDCFVTSSLAQRLGLPIRRCNIAVGGLGQNVVQVKGETSCTVLPSDSENPSFAIDAIVMNKITSKMPVVSIPSEIRTNFKHLVLADQQFDKSTDIDLLLGAELFHRIYDGQRLEVGPGLPVALHSIFGWVLTGKIESPSHPPPMVSSLVSSTRSLEEVVKRFWEVEEPPKAVLLKPDDEKCEELYTKCVSREPDGRYVVLLLLKEPCEMLGDSFDTAKSRFLRLEKRLNRDVTLRHDYGEFMKEYSDLGHMTPARRGSGKYVIPHHCVIRPDSATTRLRVVFDCGMTTTNGRSLNDIVYTGPKLQNDIVDILTKFRLHAIVFTSDISKMYRNISLRPEDRTWQHILWRHSDSDPLCEYELNTVTYGVTSSPYLAIRTLHQLAIDHGSEYPEAAEIVRHDTFMDDMTAGAPSVGQALELKDQLIQLLKHAQFELRKWSSNSPEFLESLPKDHCQLPKTFCDENHQHILKILGVQWNPREDIFTYSTSELNSSLTKRAILSNVARIYDPIGWLSPCVLLAKLLLQEMWRLQLGWDDPLPSELARKWLHFASEMQFIKAIKLSRRVTSDDAVSYELIGFSDGSSKAYGCCVYLRSITKNQSSNAHLLIAKSKVAPLKPLTVNRLELCGAVMLAGILKHMYNLLREKIPLSKVIAFTDSSTVLSWLNTEPHKLKTFVSHRVVKILDDLNVEHWQHVSTHDNPADHCSRGLSGSQLAQCSSWWTGPTWLSSESSTWPVKSSPVRAEDVPELRMTAHVSQVDVTSDHMINQLLEHYSTLTRIQRILAWCLRAIAAFKHQALCKGVLNSHELEESLVFLVRHEQKQFMKEEVQISKQIQKLSPFQDKAGLLRVGGRLAHSNIPDGMKHPLLIPKSSRLSLLIIDHFHVTYLHCGPRTLQSIIQRRFWILGIRNLIRSRLSKCVTCFKVKPVACQPIMGDLPSPRVTPTRCFQSVGIDFAGPFTVKESRRRNARTYKAYVCVFVCLAVKAIHIEVVSDLSTSAFLAALDRFVSRRGLCNFILSDCGTNFIGAKRCLNELQQLVRNNHETVESQLAPRGIMWSLNPPTGSHFGGIFESGIKSMKYHLKRVIGLQVLTLEELMTVLTKIEAVLNSRPLCQLSSDPNEVDVLTPGHFLTNGPLISLPERDLCDESVPVSARWQMLQKLTQRFWRIWQRDYLHTLQQRTKWYRERANIQIGQVVLIVDNNLPPLEWRSGRVTHLHPGNDGVVRVVSLRTPNGGVLRRPVTKLCPLPNN